MIQALILKILSECWWFCVHFPYWESATFITQWPPEWQYWGRIMVSGQIVALLSTNFTFLVVMWSLVSFELRNLRQYCCFYDHFMLRGQVVWRPKVEIQWGIHGFWAKNNSFSYRLYFFCTTHANFFNLSTKIFMC